MRLRHVAGLMANGTWTSKLGQNIDISHDELDVLERGDYGHVTHSMRRLDATIHGWRRSLAQLGGLLSR